MNQMDIDNIHQHLYNITRALDKVRSILVEHGWEEALDAETAAPEPQNAERVASPPLRSFLLSAVDCETLRWALEAHMRNLHKLGYEAKHLPHGDLLGDLCIAQELYDRFGTSHE